MRNEEHVGCRDKEDQPFVNGHFVEEPVIRGGAKTEVAAIMLLCSFTEDMGR